MSLCPPARCGCSFQSDTLEIERAASGLVTIEMPDAYANAYPVFTFLDASERDASIPAPVEGMECWLRTPNEKYRYNGSTWRLIFASNGFATTLNGIGWTLGNGTTFGWYVLREEVVTFACGVVFGTTSTYGAGSPNLALPPFPASTEYSMGVSSRWMLESVFVDATGGQYSGKGVIQTSTVVIPIVANTAATYLVDNTISSAIPFTWAVSDQLVVQGEYLRA